MKDESNSDELYDVQTENRHLKDIITALRESLEEMKIKNEEVAQEARAAANEEIIQLKETIDALRDEMKK